MPTTFSTVQPERPGRLGPGWQGSTKGLASGWAEWGWGLPLGTQGPHSSVTRLKGYGSSWGLLPARWQNQNAKATGGGAAKDPRQGVAGAGWGGGLTLQQASFVLRLWS